MYVARQVFGPAAESVAEDRSTPIDLAGNGAGVWIDEQFVGVEAESLARRIAAVHAVAIQLAGSDVVDVRVPDQASLLRQRDSRRFLAVGVVEQAQLDPRRLRSEDSEVGAVTIPGGPKRVRLTRPDR